MTQSEFVSNLDLVVEKKSFDYSVDDYNAGYQCATECSNGVIENYKNLFLEQTNNIIDCTDYIEDCIGNIIWILKETLEDKTEKNDFNIAYTKKINETIEKLQTILKDI